MNKVLPWEHFENLYKVLKFKNYNIPLPTFQNTHSYMYIFLNFFLQELIGQNSNDSSSGGGHSGLGSGPPGTPNPQQVMRPTPSPTGSSGSRSMSPAVGKCLFITFILNLII